MKNKIINCDSPGEQPPAEMLGLQWCRPIENRESKERIAVKVASLAASGEVIGAGSGSTSFLAVLALGRRKQEEGLQIAVVATSLEIELACEAVGLRLVTNPMHIDWCFDGADEIDTDNRMLKGRGGALHRERIVFAAARKRMVIADATKSVNRLGSRFPVPVEVEPSWIKSVYKALLEMDHVTNVRLRHGVAKDGPVITEQGRVLLDVGMSEIDGLDEGRILSIPGVCCTGIFSGFEFERVNY